MQEAQEGNPERGAQRKETAEATTEGEKGIYPLFAPQSVRARGNEKYKALTK